MNTRAKSLLTILIALMLAAPLQGCGEEGIPWNLESFIIDILSRVMPEEQAQPGQPTSQAPNPGVTGYPGGGTNLALKPVCFLNTGTIAATVMAWTYTPLNSESPAIASNASTVASPGGNSSACLSLPLGTYTWCYNWELGDINDDGMIEYAHALDERNVLLDESDTDDLDLAEKVTLSAPADLGLSYGVCGMDFTPYVVAQNHVDTLKGAFINMGHDGDSVTLRGPITITYWYAHAEQEIQPGVTVEYTVPEVVVIPAGETWNYVHVDGHDEHPGDWNVYIWLVSTNE